jgi:hypothetical protein
MCAWAGMGTMFQVGVALPPPTHLLGRSAAAWRCSPFVSGGLASLPMCLALARASLPRTISRLIASSVFLCSLEPLAHAIAGQSLCCNKYSCCSPSGGGCACLLGIELKQVLFRAHASPAAATSTPPFRPRSPCRSPSLPHSRGVRVPRFQQWVPEYSPKYSSHGASLVQFALLASTTARDLTLQVSLAQARCPCCYPVAELAPPQDVCLLVGAKLRRPPNSEHIFALPFSGPKLARAPTPFTCRSVSESAATCETHLVAHDQT